MTAARTACVTVEVSFTITDRATEGEMVDLVQHAIRDMDFAARLHNEGARAETRILATHVSLTGEPGGAL